MEDNKDYFDDTIILDASDTNTGFFDNDKNNYTAIYAGDIDDEEIDLSILNDSEDVISEHIEPVSDSGAEGDAEDLQNGQNSLDNTVESDLSDISDTVNNYSDFNEEVETSAIEVADESSTNGFIDEIFSENTDVFSVEPISEENIISDIDFSSIDNNIEVTEGIPSFEIENIEEPNDIIENNDLSNDLNVATDNEFIDDDDISLDEIDSSDNIDDYSSDNDDSDMELDNSSNDIEEDDNLAENDPLENFFDDIDNYETDDLSDISDSDVDVDVDDIETNPEDTQNDVDYDDYDDCSLIDTGLTVSDLQA